jgi:hypothetical protein
MHCCQRFGGVFLFIYCFLVYPKALGSLLYSNLLPIYIYISKFITEFRRLDNLSGNKINRVLCLQTDVAQT